jgi:multidrug efflux system outer membrane protein
VRLTESQQRQALLTYQQTTQGAFRDVSDALVAYQKSRETREQQQLLTAAAQDAARLSHVRYDAGATAYLEVLTNETNYFNAELSLSQARYSEVLALGSNLQRAGRRLAFSELPRRHESMLSGL